MTISVQVGDSKRGIREQEADSQRKCLNLERAPGRTRSRNELLIGHVDKDDVRKTIAIHISNGRTGQRPRRW